MPTKRRRKKRNQRQPLSESFSEYLLFGIDPEPRKYRVSFKCFLAIGTPAIKEIWDNYREEMLESWIAEYPGSRPFGWWEWDSPRDIDLMKKWRDKTFPIVRKQIEGKGMTNVERYPGMLPSFALGVPDSWESINKTNPPVYESQAAYLKRFNLLTKQEIQILSDEDYEPERITEIIDFEGE